MRASARPLGGRSCAANARSVTSAASPGSSWGTVATGSSKCVDEVRAGAASELRGELLVVRPAQVLAAELPAREAAHQELALPAQRQLAGRGRRRLRPAPGLAPRGRGRQHVVHGNVETIRGFADERVTCCGSFGDYGDQLARLLKGHIPACGRVQVCIGKYPTHLKLDHGNGPHHALSERLGPLPTHEIGRIGALRHLHHAQVDPAVLRQPRGAQHGVRARPDPHRERGTRGRGDCRRRPSPAPRAAPA